jgi:hypothetical protein
VPFLGVMELFWLLGFESEGQVRKPAPSLGVSPLGLSNELLHSGLDAGLDAHYNVWGRGGGQLVHGLAI